LSIVIVGSYNWRNRDWDGKDHIESSRPIAHENKGLRSIAFRGCTGGSRSRYWTRDEEGVSDKRAQSHMTVVIPVRGGLSYYLPLCAKSMKQGEGKEKGRVFGSRLLFVLLYVVL